MLHQSTRARIEEAAALWQIKAQEEESGKRPTMLKLLEERGYVNQIAGDRKKTEDIMRRERIGAYVGIDPTAPSMHVGHLVPFMALFWMYAHGYHTYTILGGATAQVGDPTGRTTSRSLDNPSRKANIARMHIQLKKMWANIHHHLTQRLGFKLDVGSKRGLLNNNVWLHKVSITEFFRMVGNHARVGTMLGRDTARHKMEHGDGLSYSEFTYPLLQGYDWWQLYKSLNVKLQIGGSDQMGNIMAGKEVFVNAARVDQFERNVDDLSNATPIGFTVPLLTTAAGAKFGKSEGNAIWLDPDMTSVFDQFNFFVRTLDADLERYLRLFTFLPEQRIAEIMKENAMDPRKRVAGKALAEQVCLALHGEELTEQAMSEHAALFRKPGASAGFTPTGTGRLDQFMNPILNVHAPQTNSQTAFSNSMTLPVSKIMNLSYPALLKYAGLVTSRTEGNRLIRTGGAYVGATSARQQMRDDYSFSKILQGQHPGTVREYAIDDGSALILRVGKWKTKVITVVSDAEWMQGVEKGKRQLADAESGVKTDASTETGEEKFVAWARQDAEMAEEEQRAIEDEAVRRKQTAELKALQKATKADLRMGDGEEWEASAEKPRKKPERWSRKTQGR